MVDKEIISRKISILEEYLSELQEAKDITWGKYSTDSRSRAFVERYLHLAIEATFDIGNHIIAFYNWREPDNYRDIFVILEEHKVIPHNMLESFQAMASFRNMLVHRYDKIEDEIVFGIFQKRLQDFTSFITFIKDWVNNQENL
jgi:uncharacterized protein YutE (UPF0331/DUF86 family)